MTTATQPTRYRIAMAGQMAIYFLREDRCWTLEADDAQTYDDLKSATAAYLAAAKKGKRAHFVNAGVQAFQ